MQSYLLGVPVLVVGYRHPKNPVMVSRIERKTIEKVRLEAKKRYPKFDRVFSLGRAHAILCALLKYLFPLPAEIQVQSFRSE